MKEQKILEFARKSIFGTVRRLGVWEGYEVWEPGFSDNQPRFIGFPQFILIKGNTIRWTETEEESISILKNLVN